MQFDLITTVYKYAGPEILMLMRHKYLNNFRMQLNPIPRHTHRKIINIFLVKKTTDINCYISKSRPGSHHSHQKAQKKGEKSRERALNNRYRELVVSCDSLQNQRRTDGTFILRSVQCKHFQSLPPCYSSLQRRRTSQEKKKFIVLSNSFANS